MTHPLVGRLNKLGFIYHGNEKEVTKIEEYTEERERPKITNSGNVVPTTKETKMVTITLKGRTTLDMKLDNLRSMMKHQREKQ